LDVVESFPASCRLAEKDIEVRLTPEGPSADKLFAIPDERERPYYEHRLAA